jgi:hypothetical protein
MDNTNDKPTVPPQVEGTEKNIEHAVEAADENDARRLFTIGRNRLMDVNHWDEYCAGTVSSKFQLTDEQGNAVGRTLEKEDYFKIDLPMAPGATEGKGYDWVRVEAIDDRPNPNGERESIAIRVRPSADPQGEGKNVAHFLSDSATSSFVLERNGKKVTAAVYGRNESVNLDTSNVVDKVRNAVVGTTAIAGLANVQWKNLVKGLIETV